MGVLVVLGLAVFLVVVGAAVTTILYPDGYALDQDNRRIASESEEEES